MALMEWEFSEGSGDEGQFMPTGKVIETLRRHLARNEVDEAVALYETCVQQTVGHELWQEFSSASTPMRKAIANLFYRARDYQRAGDACEQLKEWSAAARAYAADHNWIKAAECVQQAGDIARAARMYQQGGQAKKAAELYYKADLLLDAAEALEIAGDLVAAGQLFLRAGDRQRAAHALARVTLQDPRFLKAVGMLAELLVQMKRPDLAIQRLSGVVLQNQPIQDGTHAALAYRLGELLTEAGASATARQAYERVRTFDPSYRDVSARLQRLAPDRPPTGSAPALRSGTLGPQVVAGPPAAPEYDDMQTMLPTDPFAPPPPGLAPLQRHTFVQRMSGYDVLKRLPIFDELSLDEMKAFYGVCEKTVFQPGEVVIEQGQPGTGLFIVRQGRLLVTQVRPDGGETELAVVPSGQYVGEMSLVDDVPTSARVSAAERVKALRVTKSRFEQFMYTHERTALRIYRSFVKTLSSRLRDQNARRGTAARRR